MPTLKQLTCHVEWGNSCVPFKEHGTAYGDGVVESYIEVPSDSAPFSISLKSQGYISSGLAMFVFADGVYQCNRNRDDLKWPSNLAESTEADKKRCEVDFRVRQREENREGEVFTGRQWRFEPLHLVDPNSPLSQSDASSHFKYLGTIQVVVLRCTSQPDDKETPWATEYLRRSLSPESATAPVIDFEDNDLTTKGQGKNVRQTNNSLWAVYDGPGDGWASPNRENNRHKKSKRNERKSPDRNRGSPTGFRSNASVIVNVHNYSQDTDSDWRSRPLSPQTQRNSGCYNIENGRRVQGSRDWRQEQSPSEASRISGEDKNHSKSKDAGWGQSNNDEPSGWDSQPHGNGWGGDSWQNKQENNDEWANSGNDNNNNREEDNPTVNWGNDSWDVTDRPNDQNDVDSWANGNNQNGMDENNWGTNNGGDTWGGNAEDGAQADADWARVDRDGNGNNTNGNDNSGGWGNDDNRQNNDQTNTGQWANQNNGNNDGWGDDNNAGVQDANQNHHWNENIQPSNGWGEEDKNTDVDIRPKPPSIAPIQPQAQQYRPPSSHGDFPNRSEGTKPSVLVTPRLVQAARNDEPLLYTVPLNVAQEMLTTHQVQPGASAAYSHRIATPDYIDNFEKPYAMFIFKYRQKEVIEKKLGISIERDIELEKTKLERLPRETIVEQLLRAQGFTSPPTHSSQNEKQKWRPVLPLPNDFTTPINTHNTSRNEWTSQPAPQPSNPTYVPPPVQNNTAPASQAAWGAPEVTWPAPSAYDSKGIGKPSSERSRGRERTTASSLEPAAAPSSATNGGWFTRPPPSGSAPDPFTASLGAKLQVEADKRSAASSKDSWATRNTADARRRDMSRQNKSNVSNTSHRRSGSQINNPPDVWGATSNNSRKSGSGKGKNNEANTFHQEVLTPGPCQTYRPSNSSSRRSQRNENNNSIRSGGWGAQDSSGNNGGAPAPGAPEADAGGQQW